MASSTRRGPPRSDRVGLAAADVADAGRAHGIAAAECERELDLAAVAGSGGEAALQALGDLQRLFHCIECD